ncbi:hypothetical protein RHGRI_009904 [Rhododendron griersonianum]|uniref:Uncharacterized protein n=1 Tax=Rhododendron griersonianum TaxID=479676 RepID=A0AAV6KHP3_9ERIC|nr:hypothetical protein RHGRI_009904 [Rhododendron griersonianum]
MDYPVFQLPLQVYYKRKRTEILDRMWEHMMGQSSGCAAHKQLHVHRNPNDPSGEECRSFSDLSSGCAAHKQLHVHRNPNDPSGEECLVKLKMLPGITEGDRLYMFGAMILFKCDTRKEFMGLASDEIRLAWLKEKMR